MYLPFPEQNIRQHHEFVFDLKKIILYLFRLGTDSKNPIFPILIYLQCKNMFVNGCCPNIFLTHISHITPSYFGYLIVNYSTSLLNNYWFSNCMAFQFFSISIFLY